MNVTEAMEAKSDQLNALDIMGCDRIIKITRVDVEKGEQPVSVHFEGDNKRPWKPSKGMIRILAGGWGVESAEWVGKHVQLHFEPSVKYAGKEVGGIRIAAMSGIAPAGLQLSLSINRQKREPYHVKHLTVTVEEYPQARFEKALPTMSEKMKEGEMTLQQVIAQCQKTGQLTESQLAQLEAAAPTEINEDEVM